MLLEPGTIVECSVHPTVQFMVILTDGAGDRMLEAVGPFDGHGGDGTLLNRKGYWLFQECVEGKDFKIIKAHSSSETTKDASSYYHELISAQEELGE